MIEPIHIVTVVVLAFYAAALGGIIVALMCLPPAPQEDGEALIDRTEAYRSALSDLGRKGAAAANAKRDAARRRDRQRILDKAAEMRAAQDSRKTTA